MEPFIGQIQLFGFNFAPRGWAKCEGQLLPIAQNSALFSLLGTTYGGDGRTTFALPDLRGRVAVGMGRGNGLSNVNIGEKLGSETNRLTAGQLPAHQHGLTQASVSVPVSTEDADQDETDGNFLANSEIYHDAANGTYGSGPISVTGVTDTTGSSQAINNIQPSLGLNYCIALVGIFPSRS
ncbi:MAG: tail fiber protein [Bacteroidota bacterium]